MLVFGVGDMVVAAREQFGGGGGGQRCYESQFFKRTCDESCLNYDGFENKVSKMKGVLRFMGL